MRRWVGVAALGAMVLAGCSADAASEAAPQPSNSASPTVATTASTSTTTTPDPSPTQPRPDWLGTRILPRTAGGFGEILPSPPELVDRRFATVDLLPAPTDEEFAAAAVDVPDEVLARSTWSPECPVARGDLRYLTVAFWGFDGRAHTGELLVNADVVDPVIAGFAALFEDRFPIEEMRIVRADELDAEPTGDGNNTTAFVCRPSRGATSWSEHAYGRAVDINPFHNPYVKGDLVLPELASAYVDRDDRRPGMLDADAVRGFIGSGWGWGGTWRSLLDHMHVSASGR